MFNFKWLNNLTGWLVFFISASVYLMTMEPTVSLWDCGEFISCVYKLQVPHPPGAPMFVLIGRFFTLFAADKESVALMVNSMSAISSAFGILFLFWTVTMLAKRLIGKAKETELGVGDSVAVMAAGVVGALACCFADSYWFSAVEGEVYALSSFFTALVFWAILKWESKADEEGADKWLVFIAYMMGVSIGVHLLNLLTIPAMVFVYFFKRREEFDALHDKVKMFSKEVFGFGLAAGIGVFLLLFVQYGVIPGIPILMSKFELTFVNGLGMPFNSGIWAMIIVLVGAVVFGIYYSHQKGIRLLNIVATSFAMILIGYSSYFMVVIRSSANPGIDMNNPEEPFNLVSYLLREQYGESPLFHGQYYMAPINYVAEGRGYAPDTAKVSNKYYPAEDGTYKVKARKWSPSYMSKYVGIFPRMWSGQGRHVNEYRRRVSRYMDGAPEFEIIDVISGDRVVNKVFTDLKTAQGYLSQLQSEDSRTYGNAKVVDEKSFGANISYFINYQIGWMYLRYMGWNFIGRQNDIQGGVENHKNGNVMWGIPFIDEGRIIPQDNLPMGRAENMGKNLFYGLPFILGLLGLVFQFYKKWEDGLIVALLVFFTGIAIVIFLNQYPFQPRERDYAFAGSVYAFCIWIGLGVIALYDTIGKKVDGKIASIIAAALGIFAAPYLMGTEGWDDHDRSGRYGAKDFGVNYLESCAPNAILFTQGDNDTYPLWYAQEVEGIRTDIRIVNLSLLAVDWYIDYLRHSTTAKNNAVPFSLDPSMYRGDKRDFVQYVSAERLGINVEKGRHFPVQSIMKFIKSDARMIGDRNIFPTKNFAFEVDAEKVIENGVVAAEDSNKIAKVMKWRFKKNGIYKNDLMTLDLIANNNWERPIYFAVSVSPDAYLGLQKYFRLEGLAYRLTPIEGKGGRYEFGHIDTDIMYNNLMTKFKFGNVDRTEKMYIDESMMRMCLNLRIQFAKLAGALDREGKSDKVVDVLDRVMQGLPQHNVPYGSVLARYVSLYAKNGGMEQAEKLAKEMAEVYGDKMRYYNSLQGTKFYAGFKNEMDECRSVFYTLIESFRASGNKEMMEQLSKQFQELSEASKPIRR